MAHHPRSAKDHPKDAGESVELASANNVVDALGGLLQTQEAQVLGAMGLFVGYICVFFAKILNYTNPYFGVLGVAILTMLLLTLSKAFDWRSPAWWLRSFVIIIICLLLTSPQLYFAWTVSVREADDVLQAQLAHDTAAVATATAPATIKITNSAAPQ